MSNRHNWLPWLLLGICIGLFIGAWLFAQQPPTPPADKPRRGKTQPIRIVEKPA